MELQGLKGRSLALALFMSCTYSLCTASVSAKLEITQVKMTVVVVKMTAVVKQKQINGIETMRKTIESMMLNFDDAEYRRAKTSRL